MKTLNIENIKLSLNNARLKEANDENEAIKNMCSNQGDKLYVLAADIIKHGLSPFDTIAVYPSVKEKGKYIVAEGNRRITSLKLLNNPEIIKSHDNSLYKKFKKLSEQYDFSSDVKVLVFPNENDADLLHWIGLKHLGVQGGKGTDGWDATQKARYQKKISGKNQLLDFWSQLIDLSILSEEQIKKITKTNWERLISSKLVLDFLGIVKNDMELTIPKDNIKEFQLKIEKFYERLKGKTVKAVYDREAIQQLIDNISVELNGKTMLESDNNFTSHNVLEKDDEKKVQNNAHTDKTYEKENTKNNNKVIDNSRQKGEFKDIFANSKTVIPKQFYINSENVRISKIIQELKTLEVDIYPNACGILLRALFELSAKYYFEKKFGNDKMEIKFDEVISRASQELCNDKKINKSEKAALKKEKDNLRMLFNGYAHNTESYPSSESIKSIFKAHKKFLIACLEN